MTANVLQSVSQFFTKYLSVMVLLAGVLGILAPKYFQVLAPTVPWMLGIIMFGMGLTLTFKDFRQVFRHPKAVFLGMLFQFMIMPSVALALISLFPVPPEVAVGVILVGCCPGGTASNVISYIAKADVALSVSMTMINTVLSPFVTPFLVWLCAGAEVNMSYTAMMMSIMKMVLLPILAGVTCNYFFPRTVAKISNVMPSLSAMVIVLVAACVVSLSYKTILTSGLVIVTVVILHNLFGLSLGNLFARLAKLNEAQVRAMTVEVGMQNSALASTLALMFFTPVGGLAGAVFSVCHNVTGSLFASYCVAKDEKKTGHLVLSPEHS